MNSGCGGRFSCSRMQYIAVIVFPHLRLLFRVLATHATQQVSKSERQSCSNSTTGRLHCGVYTFAVFSQGCSSVVVAVYLMVVVVCPVLMAARPV